MATVTFLLAVVANADVQYYGLYVAGVKVGFASVEEHPGTYQGKSAIWRQSRVHETLTAAGSTNDSDIETTSWSTLDNRPLAEKTTASSGKQSSDIDAAFGEKTVEVDADIGSNKVHRSIAIPSGLLVEDYTRLIHEKISRPGQEITCQVFFAGELGFERLNFKTIGPATFSTGGKTLSATLTEMRTEGQVVRIFTDGVGNLVREESPLGVVQQAETKDLALATPDRRIPGPDIVTLNALKADKPIGMLCTSPSSNCDSPAQTYRVFLPMHPDDKQSRRGLDCRGSPAPRQLHSRGLHLPGRVGQRSMDRTQRFLGVGRSKDR